MPSTARRSTSLIMGMPLMRLASGVMEALSSRLIYFTANLRAPHINWRSPWATRW